MKVKPGMQRPKQAKLSKKDQEEGQKSGRGSGSARSGRQNKQKSGRLKQKHNKHLVEERVESGQYAAGLMRKSGNR